MAQASPYPGPVVQNLTSSIVTSFKILGFEYGGHKVPRVTLEA